MEDKNKSLADKVQENTNNEASFREKIESNNQGPTVGDANEVSKGSIVSSCEQTKSNALSSTSTTVSNTEKNQKDQNNLDEGTTSVGTKGSDEVASDIKTDVDNLYDGINIQVSGLVDGIGPKESSTGSNNQTVHQTTLGPVLTS